MSKPHSFLRSAIRRVWPAGPRPLILMYHRVAHAAVDPWELAVAPDRFGQQLDVLQRTRTPLSLEEFIRRLDQGSLPANAVALTFDDGYVDNLMNAKPRLASAGIPATVYLATGSLGSPDEYWWDELARLILLESGPRTITLAIGCNALSFELGPSEPPPQVESWRASQYPPNARCAAYLAIWRTLRHLPDPERASAMASLRSEFSCTRKDSLNRPMTNSEVRQLIDGGLVTIGAHTVTHPSLPGLDRGARERELLESKKACEILAGEETSGFAYPFGDTDSDVQRQVQATGFAHAVAVIPTHVTPSSDRFALPRIPVLDWDGGSFDAALRGAAS
jgi:peptidoglycan/xylan/chitin deacetylase (PgdA/CDA1 family)